MSPRPAWVELFWQVVANAVGTLLAAAVIYLLGVLSGALNGETLLVVLALLLSCSPALFFSALEKLSGVTSAELVSEELRRREAADGESDRSDRRED